MPCLGPDLSIPVDYGRKPRKAVGVLVHLFAFAIFICLRDIRLQAFLSMDCLLKSGVGFCGLVQPRVVLAQMGRWGWGLGGVRHLQSPTTVTKAYPGSASTCQTVNKAPGRTRGAEHLGQTLSKPPPGVLAEQTLHQRPVMQKMFIQFVKIIFPQISLGPTPWNSLNLVGIM